MSTQRFDTPAEDADAAADATISDPSMLIRKWQQGVRLTFVEQIALDDLLLQNRVGLLMPTFPMQEAA